ncbi:MAG TPA: radical SAM protein [Elusimicrobiota bacterium]|nr:radical SAM protein [Elusimicrobiota bacterium]
MTFTPNLVVDWLTHFTCNYRCAYCWFEGHWEENLARNRRDVSSSLIIKRFKELGEKKGPCHIQASGGEPTLLPGFLDILAEVSVDHRFWVCTNMSSEVDFFKELADRVDPERCGFTASFHPPRAALADFMGKLRLLRDRDFNFDIVCVGWPPLMDQWPAVFEELRREGFQRVRLQPFNGTYGGQKYPEAYSSAAREKIAALNQERNLFVKSQTDYLMHEKESRGRLCSSGQRYIHIQADGNVYRCNLDQNVCLGNFYDGTYGLYEKPEICHVPHCNCEWCWIVGEKDVFGKNEQNAVKA